MKKKLKAQVPAEGIYKNWDYGNSKSYVVNCVCGAPDDSIEFEISADEFNVEMVTHIISKSVWAIEIVTPNCKYNNKKIQNSWLYSIDEGTRSIINMVYRKIKLTAEVWFKGYITYHHSTAMTEQQALNYAETIKTALHDVDAFQKERLKRWDGK